METSQDEVAAAGTSVEICVERRLQYRKSDCAAAGETRKSGSHQFLEAHESGGGISWKHAHRDATPFSEAERSARTHGYLCEMEFSAQLREGAFHEVALPFRSSAGGDQQIRVTWCPLENCRESSAVVSCHAFIARFSAGGEHERRKRDGIAVAHLTVCRRSRRINEFIARANDSDSRTPEYTHCGLPGKSEERQFSGIQNFSRHNQFITAAKVFAGRKDAVARHHGRKNAHRGAKLLRAFVGNHGIGAARNRCAGHNGQGSSGCKDRFALFSEHVSSSRKLDRMILCRARTFTCPHRVAVHGRAWKWHGVFIGDHRSRGDSTECFVERDIFRRHRLHARKNYAESFVKSNCGHQNSPERCPSSVRSRRIAGPS